MNLNQINKKKISPTTLQPPLPVRDRYAGWATAARLHDTYTLAPNSSSTIICTFARSFDNSTLKDGQVHLVCSAYKCGDDQKISSEVLAINLAYFYKKKKSARKLILIKIINIRYEWDNFEQLMRRELKYVKTYEINQVNEYLMEITIPIIWFLNERYEFYNKDQNILELIFGDLNSKKKSFDAYLNDTIFVFEGFDWYFTIKSFFKLYKINISGGTTSSRFVMSTVHANLISFLILMELYSFLDNKLIYGSFVALSESKNITTFQKKYPEKKKLMSIDLNSDNPSHPLKVRWGNSDSQKRKYQNNLYTESIWYELFTFMRIYFFIQDTLPIIKRKVAFLNKELTQLFDQQKNYSDRIENYKLQFEFKIDVNIYNETLKMLKSVIKSTNKEIAKKNCDIAYFSDVYLKYTKWLNILKTVDYSSLDDNPDMLKLKNDFKDITPDFDNPEFLKRVNKENSNAALLRTFKK